MRIGHLAPSVFIAALITSTSGCYIEAFNEPGDATTGSNIPVVGQSSDGLGYALHAKTFSATESYGPVVQSRFISVGMAVAGYNGGSVNVQVRDAASTLVIDQVIASNITQASSVGRGVPPFTVSLSFKRFSGNFSLGIGKGDSTQVR